jgi:hypothetical protein
MYERPIEECVYWDDFIETKGVTKENYKNYYIKKKKENEEDPDEFILATSYKSYGMTYYKKICGLINPA